MRKIETKICKKCGRREEIMKRIAIILLSIMMVFTEMIPAYAETVGVVGGDQNISADEDFDDDSSVNAEEEVFEEEEFEGEELEEEELEGEELEEEELEGEELEEEELEKVIEEDETDEETIRTDGAASVYNPSAALEYARNHWNDGVGLCSEFVSRCINNGGCSAFSKSCTALRSQLLNSGMGTEYEINLSTGQTINMNNYSGKITAGDVVFYYCPSCVYSDGKPYIHAVLCNGADSSGYMKAFSHNNANSGSSRYSYRSTCYVHTSTAITKAYVFHFNSSSSQPANNSRPIGCIDGVSGGYGGIEVNGWAFDPDDTSIPIDIHIYIGGLAGSSSAEGINIGAAKCRRDDVNAAHGCGNYHGYSTWIPTSRRGKQTVYIYAIDSTYGYTLLGSRTVNILEPVQVNCDASSISVKVGETKELGASVVGDGIAKIACTTENSNIAKTVIKDFDWSAGKGHFSISGVKSGVTTAWIKAYDSNDNVLKSRKVEITVTATELKYNVSSVTLEEEKKASVQISWGSFTGTIAPRLANSEVAGLSWGSIDHENRNAELILSGLKAGRTELITELRDSNGVVITTKSIPIIVTDKPVTYSLLVDSQEISITEAESETVGVKFSTKNVSDVSLNLYNTNIANISCVSKNISAGSAKFKVHGLNAGTTTGIVKLYGADGSIVAYKSVKITVNEKTVGYALNVYPENITLDVGEKVEVSADFSTEKISDVELSIVNGSISTANVISKNLSKGMAVFGITGKQPGGTLARVKLLKKDGSLAVSKYIYVKVNKPTPDSDPEPEHPELEEPETEEGETENAETEESDSDDSDAENSEIDDEDYFELSTDSVRMIVGTTEVIDAYFDPYEVAKITVDSQYAFFKLNVDADYGEGEASVSIDGVKKGCGDFTITAYDDDGDIIAEKQISVYVGSEREGRTYTIKYKPGKGAEYNNNPEQYCPIEIDEDIELEDASRTGYIFKGWYDKRGRRVTAISSSLVGNMVFTAKWAPIKYRIQFNAGVNESETMGLHTKTVNAKYGNSYFLRRRFRRNGYKLTGWSTTKGGEPTYKVGQRVKNLCDQNNQQVVLYAVWEES